MINLNKKVCQKSAVVCSCYASGTKTLIDVLRDSCTTTAFEKVSSVFKSGCKLYRVLDSTAFLGINLNWKMFGFDYL